MAFKKQFVKLTERAQADLCRLSSREAILLYIYLLAKGGPCSANKSQVRLAFHDSEKSLEELISNNLIIEEGDFLYNPFYFVDCDNPSNAFGYNKGPRDIASNIYVSKDLVLTKDERGAGTLAEFHEEVWNKSNKSKRMEDVERSWASFCLREEGKYKEEMRQDETRRAETSRDDRERDKNNASLVIVREHKAFTIGEDELTQEQKETLEVALNFFRSKTSQDSAKANGIKLVDGLGMLELFKARLTQKELPDFERLCKSMGIELPKEEDSDSDQEANYSYDGLDMIVDDLPF